jgi:hypothetical protein
MQDPDHQVMPLLLAVGIIAPFGVGVLIAIVLEKVVGLFVQ